MEEKLSVLLVDQDLMTASVMKQFIVAVPGFYVAGISTSLPHICVTLQKNQIDLVVFEPLGLAENIAEVVGRIHRISPMTAFIVVSSKADQFSVRQALSLGALDYVLKPFSFERFRRALYICQDRKKLLSTLPKICMQNTIDEVIVAQRERLFFSYLPNGIQKETLEQMAETLSSLQEAATIDEIAQLTGFSRTTTWRYLHYLLNIGRIVSTLEYQVAGRPLKKFLYIK
ncbi:MAG: response regulator [Aminobacterium sp.]|jgi:CitB family two-component system response regulator MalR|uniref:response regulator n=3 Tax=unclassified Aminobacterium TaxID=2685012 RepID=UPI001BCDAE5A|nr:response regulator [Aminobacterium sp. MB27-C1]MDD2207256.1 response regulator [Aminobacterium sp.]MDD3425254.1 response regulator [Aminobacterium sp.]MDD4229174.1 response regulator [Aminobacterium sp.]WMI71430.1 response regulator [Aminobacterium sp. MB27-C1]